MTEQDLIKGKAILALIKTTELAVEEAKKFLERPSKGCGGEEYKTDQMYNLNISEHSDGSGTHLSLGRYYGNRRLLQVILAELENQLAEFKEDFEAI